MGPTTTFENGERPMDPILLAITLLLSGYGVVMVYSSSAFFAERHAGSSFYFANRQLIYVILGCGLMWLTSRIPYERYKAVMPALLGATALALILVLIPGVGLERLGARRWINLSVLPFQPQPSEFAKIVLVLYMARSLSKVREGEDNFVSGFLKHLILPLGLLALILVEPDFGTVILMLVVAVAMLFVAGSRLKYLVYIGLVMLPIGGVALLLFEHARHRLELFFQQLMFMGSQGDYALLCYQVRESLISFGSGQAFGMGLGEGTMKIFFLPQSHSDFILATIGQELGFLFGTLPLFLLFLLFAWRGYRIAWRVPDTFGCFTAFGVTTLILAQFGINAGVVLGILPPKGIALPFISYGGSALLASLMGVGILLNISRHTVTYTNPKRGRR